MPCRSPIVLLMVVAAGGCYDRGLDYSLAGLPTEVGEAEPPAFAAHTQLPYAQLGMTTEARDINGRPARVPCATCHAQLEAKPEHAFAEAVGPPHATIQLEHGGQTCHTCHVPPAFEQFRLQSGRTVPYHQVVDMCGQCHGLQRRDYERGLHGGMTGYWDLDRGPRRRNHCLDCHNAHRPAIGQVEPAPAPRYRFTAEGAGHE